LVPVAVTVRVKPIPLATVVRDCGWVVIVGAITLPPLLLDEEPLDELELDELEEELEELLELEEDEELEDELLDRVVTLIDAVLAEKLFAAS
jgi:hypothetical protein